MLEEKTATFVYEIRFINLEFEVLKNADNTRFDDGDDIKLTNLGPIALFSEASLKTSSGKHLEKIDNLHTVSLMYKLLTLVLMVVLN